VPRANRYILPGHIYHVTHRCHDRQFLLKFARDRDAYRRRLLDGVRKYRVKLLNYAITSNHVHLVLWAESAEQVAGFIHDVAGEFAREFNRRKRRSGGFWEGRYQVTMVEGGVYLERCLVYVDLNMVRCGMVSHPQEWAWTGYLELMGRKKRNRLLDMAKLLELLGGVSLLEFREHHEKLLEERMAKDQMKREPEWTEAIAVGDEQFIERIEPLIRNRREIRVGCLENGGWILQEAVSDYGSISVPEK